MRQWRIAAAADRTAPEPFYRLSRVAARTSRCAPATPSSQTVRRRTGRDCGRRPVRGVRSEEGKSGLEARQAPSLGIRHRRTGQLVTETIPPCPSNHPRRRRHRQHTRRKTRFSTPSNPGPPTRTPARWGGNREPILGPPGEPTLRTCRKRASVASRHGDTGVRGDCEAERCSPPRILLSPQLSAVRLDNRSAH